MKDDGANYTLDSWCHLDSFSPVEENLACPLTGATVGASRAGSRADFPIFARLRRTTPQLSYARQQVLFPFLADFLHFVSPVYQCPARLSSIFYNCHTFALVKAASVGFVLSTAKTPISPLEYVPSETEVTNCLLISKYILLPRATTVSRLA